MLNIVKNIARINSLKEQHIPKHIAISTRSLAKYKKDINSVDLGIKKIIEFISKQVNIDLPILTIAFENKSEKDIKLFSNLIDTLLNHNIISQNKIKIMIIGNWFNLPINLTEKIKKLMSQTEDYDCFFLNLLIEYSGKKEIEAVIKLLTIRANAKKIDVEKIDEKTIKESLYTSYFLPPELLIECSYAYSGILLFDIKDCPIYLTQEKPWLELEKKDLDNALLFYKKSKMTSSSH